MDEKCGYKTPTPADSLEQQIIDPSFPKNEREWWASEEITRLRAEVEALKAENAALASWQCLFTDGTTGLYHDGCGNAQCARDHLVVHLTAEVEALRADAERKRIELETMGDTVTSLRSEVALYRGESTKFRDLLNSVPLPPFAITYERGWKLIDTLLAAAIDAARAAQGGEHG